jgi:hypothetical protein
MRLPALVALVTLAGCGSSTLVRRGVTGPSGGRRVLADGRVYTMVSRDHYKVYDTDQGALPSLWGMGSSDLRREETESRTEELGVIAVDVHTGSCRRERAVPAPTAPMWATPVAIEPTSEVTAPGAVLRWQGLDLHARTPTLDRVVRGEGIRHTRWLRGTDAVVTSAYVVDVVDGDRWHYDGGVAALGERLFFTTGQSIVELSAAPLAQVARHVPDGWLPELRWLARLPWTVGETHAGATLRETADGVSVEADGWTQALGKNRGAIYLYGELGLVQGDGLLLDLTSRRVIEDVPGYPRVGRTAGESPEIVLEANGRFWELTPGRDRAIERRWLDLLGFDRGVFVFDRPEQSTLLVFEISSRTWREVAYRRCYQLAADADDDD